LKNNVLIDNVVCDKINIIDVKIITTIKINLPDMIENSIFR